MKISGIEKPRTGRPNDWREARRFRALALAQKGWQQNRIAEALGVTKGAVSQWLKKTRNLPHEQHEQTLQTRKSTGRKPALTAENRAQLLALVERGAPAFGFIGDVWTANRVRIVARRELDLRVGLTTIKKFLHQAGYSVQKPEVTATQKNEKAVSGFRGGWANLKRGHNESGNHSFCR